MNEWLSWLNLDAFSLVDKAAMVRFRFDFCSLDVDSGEAMWYHITRWQWHRNLQK